MNGASGALPPPVLLTASVSQLSNPQVERGFPGDQ